MNKIKNCRRTFICILGMILITIVSLAKGFDAGFIWAIAAMSGAIAGANSIEKIKGKANVINSEK